MVGLQNVPDCETTHPALRLEGPISRLGTTAIGTARTMDGIFDWEITAARSERSLG
jgi:hypothetical protein